MSLNKTRKRAIARARAREPFNIIAFARSVELAAMEGLAKGLTTFNQSINKTVRAMEKIARELDLVKNKEEK